MGFSEKFHLATQLRQVYISYDGTTIAGNSGETESY